MPQRALYLAGQMFKMVRDLLAVMKPHCLFASGADTPIYTSRICFVCGDLFAGVRSPCRLHSLPLLPDLRRLLCAPLLFRPTLPLCGCDPCAGLCAHDALLHWLPYGYGSVIVLTGEDGAGFCEGGNLGVNGRQHFRSIHEEYSNLSQAIGLTEAGGEASRLC